MGKLHQDDVRAKIKTSQLLNRLSDHAHNKVDLKNSQVKAIEILLKKVLPDLANVQLSGDENNPVHLIAEVKETICDPRIKHS